MPQFDKITFFNQIFWLFIFFSGFYLISLKVFLPKLSSVLKARTKKLQKGSEGLTSFNDELKDVNVSFNSSIEEMSAVVKTSVSDFKEKTDTWVDSAVETINKEELKSSNAFMEKALHKQIAVTHLLSNVKVMLLFTNPCDVARLVKAGIKIDTVNIGGMKFSEGKKMITNFISVDEEDIKAFNYLASQEIELEIRKVPSDRRISLTEVLKKAE